LTESKCQSIYWNLIRCQNTTNVPATAYIREFFETERCDEFNDFSPHRNEIEVKLQSLSNGALSRVLILSESDIDEKAVAQVCLHYHSWHNSKLVRTLTWSSWFYYHTIERSERAFASLGFLGASYGAFKVI
jgi:hypothetical protein